jgi:hypothetical protein
VGLVCEQRELTLRREVRAACLKRRPNETFCDQSDRRPTSSKGREWHCSSAVAKRRAPSFSLHAARFWTRQVFRWHARTEPDVQFLVFYLFSADEHAATLTPRAHPLVADEGLAAT